MENIQMKYTSRHSHGTDLGPMILNQNFEDQM